MPAIAAAWKYNKGQNGQMQEVENQAARLLSYQNIGARISQVDDILKRKAEQALFPTDGETQSSKVQDDAAKGERKEKMVKELLKKVKKRRKLVRSYSYFTWFCAFFGCFLGNLYIKQLPNYHEMKPLIGELLQQQNEHLSSVDASIKNRIVDILPSGNIGDNGQFYEWLNQVVNDVFDDPVCGNGVCERPFEYPGFGRFGCIRDCGRYAQRTSITIDVMSAWSASPGGLDLSKFVLGSGDSVEIKYAYNIYSETMGAYLLEKNTAQASITLDVPDGNLRLDLYQMSSVSTEALSSHISLYGSVAPSTMVKSNRSFDFKYGDAAEAIASSAILNRQIKAFCSSGMNSTGKCCDRCYGRYDRQSIGDKLRNMYGLSGNVSILDGAVRQNLVSFPFCALTPDILIDAFVNPKLCDPSATSGGLLKCYNGTAVAQQFDCKSSYSFSVWSFGQPRYVTVVPNLADRKRTLTPFNNVIGGIIITQYTRKMTKCPQNNGDAISLLTSQFTCESEDIAETPFGVDPVFQPTSVLYNGREQASNYYADNERWSINVSDVGSRSYPYAFFPHQWDAGGLKSSAFTSAESVGLYKLFLDSRLTASKASDMVQFLKDGLFISNKTDWIELEVITYNADFNLFGILTLQFRWTLGGSILWDYQYNTALLSPYEGVKGQVSLSLDLVFGLMLLADIVRECRDIYHAVLRENLYKGYILKFWNWVEWTQYVLLSSCFGFWTQYNQYINSVQFKSSYPVLRDLKASARFFATDPKNEFELLDFTIKMRRLSELKNFWTALSCVNILIYVMRFLKLLDFQPRMSLITRTLQVASVDLGHYLTLFCIIFVGYATIGTILLGDRMRQFQTFSDSCSALFMLLMGWEPETMYRNMLQATNMAKIGTTQATFQIFFWTWVLIATFLMLNIVLAIIVDAFAHIKSNLKDAPTITGESASICKQVSRMIGNRLYGKEWLISDKEFEKVLLSHDRGFQSRQKFLNSIGQIRGAGKPKVVRLAGGMKVSDQDLEGLLEGSSCTKRQSLLSRAKKTIKKQTSPIRRQRRMSISFTGLKEDGVEIAEDNIYRPPPPIWDLINRYGEFVSDGQDDEELLEYLEAENMKREMTMYATQDQIRERIEVVKDTLESMVNFVLPMHELEKLRESKELTLKKRMMIDAQMRDLQRKSNYIFDGELKVNMISAKRLPKLDLFSESDPYCVLLIEEDNKQNVLACTDTRSNEPNPIWNSEHSVPLKCTADTHLVFAVLDRDDQGLDDLIGAIKLAICDLPMDEELDRWYRLRNESRPNLTKKALVRIKVKLLPKSTPPHSTSASRSEGDSAKKMLQAKLLGQAAALENELQWLDQKLLAVSEEEAHSGPVTFEVTLVSAQHLPKRRALFSKLSLLDAYVKVSFQGTEYDSVVRRNTYNPVWGQSFSFVINDTSRPTRFMHLTVIDWNKYSQHEVIGSVEINEQEMSDIMNECCNGSFEERTFDIERNGNAVVGYNGKVAELTLAFRAEERKSGPSPRTARFECEPAQNGFDVSNAINCDANADYEDSHSDCELGPPILTDPGSTRSLDALNASISQSQLADTSRLREHCRPSLQTESPQSFRARQRARIAKQLASDFGGEIGNGFGRVAHAKARALATLQGASNPEPGDVEITISP